MRVQQVLTLSEIEALKAKGLSQSDIARAKGCTRANVSWHVNTYGGSLTKRQEILREVWPFLGTTAHHGGDTRCKNLRNHAEYMVTGGKGMPEWKLKRLRTFYKILRDNNLVVEFDPSIPSGFRYVDRTPDDGGLLIRVNEYTDITEKGMKIWIFPPREP